MSNQITANTIDYTGLIQVVDRMPRLSGVYLMRAEDSTVIYVGKAKDLRARVKTYFLGGDGRLQLPALLERVRSIDTIVTENEEQAFILERDLIAKYKPRYNIRLKDDKNYLSVRVDIEAPWPRLELVRRRDEGDSARYFGPYTSGVELRAVLEIVKRTIPLRSCANTVFYNRARPCLEYQIKRCAGPCCLPVDPEQYRRWVKQAISILQGRTDGLVSEFEEEMEQAAADLRFEDAAVWRDRIDILKAFKRGQSTRSWSGEDRDVFALYREESLAALAVLHVRGGRLSEADNFVLNDVAIPDAEILEGAIEQYYEGGREIPAEIVVPFEPGNAAIIEQSLRTKSEHAVSLIVPQRGTKARLAALAETNAKHFFSSRFDADTRYQAVAGSLAERLGLRQVPRRIECVDISNLQGSDTVGALVCFFDGVPEKSSYRKFRVKQEGKPDDFASIFEVVQRRLRRGFENNDLPDLLIIDGGPGQLSKAIEARDEVKADVEIVALAKQRTESDLRSARIEKSSERIFVAGRADPIELLEGDEVTNFVSRIRDEAHRFVITFHRSSRTKRVFRSALDDIAGVGRERRTRLLRHFRSIEKIALAPAHEIASVGRMPLPLAQKILDHLAKNREKQ